MTLEAVQVEKRLLSISDYHKMIEVGILGENDRVELIYGEIIKMSAVHSPHSSRVKRISNFFFRNLPPLSANISVQDPITLPSVDSEPEPDIVIANYREDFYLENHPTPSDIHLVIEVSHSTLKYDRVVKTSLYAKADIPLYWIVNVEEEQIEVYSKPKNGEYSTKQVFEKGKTFRLESFDLEVEVDLLLG